MANTTTIPADVTLELRRALTQNERFTDRLENVIRGQQQEDVES